MYQWTVNGQNQLNKQWFYYRVDGYGDTYQHPINALGGVSYTQDQPNHLNTTFANVSFGVTIDYLLVGGGAGSGQADILEGITLHNYSASQITFHFYQYSDFNLLNDPNGDTVDMDATYAFQQKGPTQIAEGIIAPDASFFEANITGQPTSTLAKLAGTQSLSLGDYTHAYGDVTWAFQWDMPIDANSDQNITKDKLLDVYVIPEPSALALLGLGMSLFLLRRRAQV